MLKQVRTFGRFLRRYFKAYGGWSAVLGSPLFLLAVIITGLNYSEWLSDRWVALAQSMIPSLLGFSLGTYAILFSIISNRLKGALREVKTSDGSRYLDSINATFFHFIFVQVVALVWSFLNTGTGVYNLAYAAAKLVPLHIGGFRFLSWAASAMGYLLLVYSALLVVSASLVIYRLALIRDPADEPKSAQTPAPETDAVRAHS